MFESFFFTFWFFENQQLCLVCDAVAYGKGGNGRKGSVYLCGQKMRRNAEFNELGSEFRVFGGKREEERPCKSSAL